MAYTTRILDTGTTFLPESDGTWTISDFTGQGKDDLVFIKQFNTGTNSVEVHVASAASGYQTRIFEAGTTFANETDGVFQLFPVSGGKPDLIFIKTANTPSGKVEVHVASGASGYKTRILETPTTFVCEQDGTWMMADYSNTGKPDLVFIKTGNAGASSVEVHVASAASGYQERILETGTTFKEETDGTWILRPFSEKAKCDLVFIKTANTGTGKVEVHVASAASGYQTRVLEVPTLYAPETDGVWTFSTNTDPSPNLIFIKTGPNTGTGKVEMHAASGK